LKTVDYTLILKIKSIDRAQVLFVQLVL